MVSWNKRSHRRLQALSGVNYKATKKRSHEEDDECKQLVFYLDTLVEAGQITHYTHIPNETYTPFHSVRNKNKLLGVRSGFPDYVITTPSKVLFIEMKKTKGGVVSDNQKKWHQVLKRAGQVVEVCKGFGEAKLVVDREIEGKGELPF